MSGNKKSMMGMVCLFLMVFASVNLFSNGYDTKPLYVEVGLNFQQSSKAVVNLQTNTGFQIEKFEHNNFNSLLSLFDHKEVILRKDAYYLGTGGRFVEYTGEIPNENSSLNLQGPYHVQIGTISPDLNQAKEQLSTLKSKGYQGYLSYEAGWMIFQGPHLNQEQAQRSAEEIELLLNERATVIAPSQHRVQVLDKVGELIFVFDSREGLYFKAVEDKGSVNLISVDNQQYRGAVTATRLSGSDMTVINKLLLDEYLYGVVPREMPASWPIEALKAQAVVARSYAAAEIQMSKYKHLGFDLSTTTSSQVYGGYASEHNNSTRAVQETAGVLVMYNGKPANTYYHSNSGGSTEDSENVWSGSVPYIRGVQDEFSLNALNSTWVEALTAQEIKAALAKNNIHIGDVQSIEIRSQSKNERVLELIVYGTQGEKSLEKEQSRRIFGLKSTWFDVKIEGQSQVESQVQRQGQRQSGELHILGSSNGSKQAKDVQKSYVITSQGPREIDLSSNILVYNGQNYRQQEKVNSTNSAGTGTFVFEGKGFGHGLGMSQYGAKRMAELNYNYQQILNHYYTGIKVE
ncbi:SpoIID/LytB domain protein [Alkaliphilus metalliredigens QYMF]|uniref:SpoIID/LytB domain protein n=1 Tax=Alkaliphilus metalliredigens (strain QYMF) TaxID=293826 RepID=A6TQM6_ALKMQ|nr:SpoIID/LytB domain-containing protein [Alkaliphilus metalliredigens]ABR48494.1 SpoIID/LytB domain protein [Alkaliphilus metalliredigens QYMF]